MAALTATDPRLFLSDVTTGHGERVGYSCGTRIVAGAVGVVRSAHVLEEAQLAIWGLSTSRAPLHAYDPPVWDQRVAGASSTKSGSHKTRRWSKGDSNSPSHPERQRFGWNDADRAAELLRGAKGKRLLYRQPNGLPAN
jgi:hypothetical protein